MHLLILFMLFNQSHLMVVSEKNELIDKSIDSLKHVVENEKNELIDESIDSLKHVVDDIDSLAPYHKIIDSFLDDVDVNIKKMMFPDIISWIWDNVFTQPLSWFTFVILKMFLIIYKFNLLNYTPVFVKIVMHFIVHLSYLYLVSQILSFLYNYVFPNCVV